MPRENLNQQGLTNEYVNKLHKLVRDHPPTFTKDDHDLCHINVLIHHIKMIDAPQRKNYSLLPEKLLDDFDQQITNMMAKGFMR